MYLLHILRVFLKKYTRSWSNFKVENINEAYFRSISFSFMKLLRQIEPILVSMIWYNLKMCSTWSSKYEMKTDKNG